MSTIKEHLKMTQIHGFMEVRDYFFTIVYEIYHGKLFMEDKKDGRQRSRNYKAIEIAIFL